jgi:hypothetical protein
MIPSLTGTDFLWLAFWPVLGILIVYFSFRRRMPVGLLIVLVLVLGPILGFVLGMLSVSMLAALGG